MRTTVTINDQLLAEVKLIAARTHRTIDSIVEDALRALLDETTETRAAAPRLPRIVYEDPSLRPGVDLDDQELMASLLGGAGRE